jgi:hypothetical protein
MAIFSTIVGIGMLAFVPGLGRLHQEPRVPDPNFESGR